MDGMGLSEEKNFYRGKRVFVTGHTGFKGSWMCKYLTMLGAEVTGYALPPEKGELYELLWLEPQVRSYFADIRDLEKLKDAMTESKPEIVLHLAAQPIVLRGYEKPVETFETNVMGTVNLLEAIRETESVRSVINVTTDKVYRNLETDTPYTEDNELMGRDPYANSKSCSELVTYSYRKSYLDEKDVAVSTCRAGNVIGGGDFAENRILPDCFRAVQRGEPITVRHPDSIRPYQHVMEPIFAYLLLARLQYENHSLAGSYNIGPEESDQIRTGEIASYFCKFWGNGASWSAAETPASSAYESKLLKLDCAKAKETLHWRSVWDVRTAVRKTVEWYLAYAKKQDLIACTERQIGEFLANA